MIWYDGIHMMTDCDDLEELHAEAERIGMSRAKFQDHPTHPHYDVWGAPARKLTVNCGSKDLLRRCRLHVHRTVWPNHSFHWQTRLTNERMREIDRFLGRLTEDERRMVRELMEDAVDEHIFSSDEGA